MNWALLFMLSSFTLLVGTFVGLAYWASWDEIKADLMRDDKSSSVKKASESHSSSQ